MKRSIIVGAFCFLLGTATFSFAQFTGLRPEQFVTLPWTWTAVQTAQTGNIVTSLSLTAGNTTVDCSQRPGQYVANTGAFVVTAPSNDGYCYLDVENGSGAGAITLSGFSPNTMGGAILDTTSGHNFRLVISRVHGHSNIFAIALQ